MKDEIRKIKQAMDDWEKAPDNPQEEEFINAYSRNRNDFAVYNAGFYGGYNSRQPEINKLSLTKIAGDRMAEEVDKLIDSGKLNSRSPLADARLEYNEPGSKSDITILMEENQNLKTEIMQLREQLEE